MNWISEKTNAELTCLFFNVSEYLNLCLKTVMLDVTPLGKIFLAINGWWMDGIKTAFSISPKLPLLYSDQKWLALTSKSRRNFHQPWQLLQKIYFSLLLKMRGMLNSNIEISHFKLGGCTYTRLGAGGGGGR